MGQPFAFAAAYLVALVSMTLEAGGGKLVVYINGATCTAAGTTRAAAVGPGQRGRNSSKDSTADLGSVMTHPFAVAAVHFTATVSVTFEAGSGKFSSDINVAACAAAGATCSTAAATWGTPNPRKAPPTGLLV